MKRILSLSLLLFVVSAMIPVVVAGEGPYPGPGDAVGDVFSAISDFFSMGWLEDEDQRDGFLRFLLFILVFTVVFSAGVNVFSAIGPDGHERRNAGVLATVISAITVIFTPISLLKGIFASYTTVVIVLLVGLPIGLIYYLVYHPSGIAGSVSNPVALRILRIIGLLLVWFILSEVGNYASSGGAGAFEEAIVLALPAGWIGGDD